MRVVGKGKYHYLILGLGIAGGERKGRRLLIRDISPNFPPQQIPKVGFGSFNALS